MSNPFYSGGPVESERFIGRKNEIGMLQEQIIKGDSALVVGDPRIGKTSLLRYISAESVRNMLYGSIAQKLHFVYLDAQTFEEYFDPAHFWRRVLEEYYERKVKFYPVSNKLTSTYLLCLEGGFDREIHIEGFWECMKEEKLRLVILIDEFDRILSLSKLNRASFLGQLRSFSSRFQSLSCILSVRNSPVVLNGATQEVAKQLNLGSPFFNTFKPVYLAPFSDKDSSILLARANDQFVLTDRQNLLNLTGGHPCFLQIASGALWKAYSKFPQDISRRWQYVDDELYVEIKTTLEDVWEWWPARMRIALIAIGLPQMSIRAPEFRQQDFNFVLSQLQDEIKDLTWRGWILGDAQDTTGLRVRSAAVLRWLTQKIASEVRDEASAREWLQKRQLDDVLKMTREQKERWNAALQWVGKALADSLKSLAESASKSILLRMQ